MAKKVTMTFWRDNYSGPACLEYSWVPEGLRRNIQLMVNKKTQARIRAFRISCGSSKGGKAGT